MIPPETLTACHCGSCFHCRFALVEIQLLMELSAVLILYIKIQTLEGSLINS